MDKNILLSDLKADVSEYDAKALGDTVRLLREGLQLTQSELGENANVSTAEISKIETGNRVKIPLETLIKICPYLNVSLEYLLISCIPFLCTDREHFFNYHGEEINLFAIAKKLYSVDSELLLLLDSSDFLADSELIKLIKSWIHLQIALVKNKSNNTLKLYSDFKKYSLSFLETLSNSIENQ